MVSKSIAAASITLVLGSLRIIGVPTRIYGLRSPPPTKALLDVFAPRLARVYELISDFPPARCDFQIADLCRRSQVEVSN